ncbi:DMT family transporter [Azohydromonas sediminis]|uniref:DMT family transporter n=1 Tax=Azohydromonas sediminis TaxID=2259674 RepID=UPI000E658B27|nr:DMT family transporter [Azohydromonas sediminis]
MSVPSSPRALAIGAASAVAVLLIWSSFIVVARYGARLTLTPFDVAFVRFVFSGLVGLAVLAVLAPRGASPLAGLGWRRIAVLAGTAGIGYCSLAYSAFFFAPAAHGAVLMPGSLPLWTALAALVLLGERLTARRMLGLALIVAGDLLVGGASLARAFDGDTTWRGDLMFLAAAMCWGTYTVLCRRWQVGAVAATLAIAVGCLASYVPLYALGAAMGWWPSALAAASWTEIGAQALYQGGLAMWVAGVAFTHAVRTFGPVRTTMVTALVPGIAALAAVPLLGEPLGAHALAGLACVTLGLFVGLRAVPAPAPAAALAATR